MKFGNLMSKIGQKPIAIPKEITVDIMDNTVRLVSGNQSYETTLPDNLSVKQEENNLILKRRNETKESKSLHGLFRQLIGNIVVGMQTPWQKQLEIVGTGFSVKAQGEDLVFKLGYSHPITFKKQGGVNYKVESATKVTVLGMDKQLVGQVAFQIKKLKQPDAYKGKGIRYAGEVVRTKPGKKAKAAGAVGAA